MRTTPHIVETVRESIAAHREERQRHHELERELAAFSTPNDKLELEEIFSRYPEEETREMQNILHRADLYHLAG